MEGEDWLTELAWSEWDIRPDELWSDEPNCGRARYRTRVGEQLSDADIVWEPPASLGLTFPRLFTLLDGYTDRRRRELHEQGSVAAVAAHDPKQLDRLERPARPTRGTDSIADYRRRRARH